MRTAIITALGFILWGLCLGAARLAGGAAATAGTPVFLVLWFVAAGATKAGYPMSDELPIFLLIFAVPAAVALFVRFRWLNAA